MTTINVDVADDIRNAKVYVSVMGTDKQQALCMRGLSSARGYLQGKVAERLQTKQTPILTFVLDQSVKRSLAASALIREAIAHDQSPDEQTEHSDEAPPDASEPQTPDAADDPLDEA